jgi:glyoxylase-like metal-dependent hydrolase (beta-lactamase superfamily II)
MAGEPTIHRYPRQKEGAFVNAYLVETDSGVVAVDSLLTVSDSRTMRAGLEELGKPLRAVLLTHSHPDHYGGLTELVAGDDVPIIAPQGVIDAIARDDDEKEQILRPMFGDEWPRERAFPNRIVAGGDRLSLAGLEFTVLDLGPGESPHDSLWLLGDDRRTVFSGDQFYNHMHAYLADGFHEQWLEHIATLRGELPGDALLHPGHGDPAGPELLDWQQNYIRTFVDAVRRADWSDPERAKAAVIDAAVAFLPARDLRFLMELSVEPLAAALAR